MGELSLIEEMRKDESKFMDMPLNKRARDDFRFLCLRTNFSVMNNVRFQSVKGLDAFIGDFLPVGHDASEKMVAFPKEYIDVNNESQYIAVMIYKNNDVAGCYLFKATDFKKTGMFSMYKYNKETNMYGIALPGESKLQTYSFAYVLKIKN